MKRITLGLALIGLLAAPHCRAETMQLLLNDFLPQDASVAFTFDAINGMAYPDGALASLVGKLDIPDGAILNSAAFHGYDFHSHGSDVFSARICWRELSSGVIEGPYGQIYSASPGHFSQPLGGDLPHTVDLSSYAYFAEVTWTGGPSNSDTAFSCITLDYTPVATGAMPALSAGSLALLAGLLGWIMVWMRRRTAR